MSTSVSIDARVVAAGVGAKLGQVRLTISLLPAAPRAGDTPVDIATWPAWAKQWKDNGRRLKLFCEPVAVPSAKRPVAPSVSQEAFEHELPFNIPQFADNAASVMRLWNEVALAALRGQGGGDQAISVFWEKLASVFVQAGSSPPYSNGGVPNVVPTARADAAILHLLAQTDRLAKRVLTPEEHLSVSPEVAGRGVSSPPWIGEGFNIEASTDAEAAEKALKKILQEEQSDVARRAEDLSGKNQVVLRKLAELLDPAKEQYPAYAPIAGQPTLTGYTVTQLFGDRAEPLGQSQMLYLAALLPDAERQPGEMPKGALDQGAAGKLESNPDKTAAVGGDLENIARTFVAAIRSSPMLARLFRFVVDVEIEVAALNLVYVQPERPEVDEPYAFAFLGAGETDKAGRVDPKQLMFSVAKATTGRDGKSLVSFWPATREELDLRCLGKKITDIRATGAVSQIDGVVDLGQSAGEAGKDFNPRYDVISIDPIHAMEASARNSRKIVAVKESMERLGLPDSTMRAAFETQLENGIVTRGLCIVDRWRAESVASEIIMAGFVREASSDPKKTPLRIVDGDDLTIGYRVDVAVRVGEGDDDEWRSLMERDIDYRRVTLGRDAGDDFRRWIEEVARSPELNMNAPRRRDYDAGIILPAARRRLLAKGEMVHAEELIAAWEGDPLGLNCGSDEVWVRPGSDIAISRYFDLPRKESEEERKSWPLRYGWAYRFGVRPVWLGGVSLPLDQAVTRYRRKNDYKNLALPGIGTSGPLDVKGWRRFLRHDPILAPVVLLPEAVAGEKPFTAPQSGVRATLRTLGVPDEDDESRAFNRDYKNRENDSTWRVILPPRVSLDEAVRHGVFDGPALVDETAPGDLLEVDYDSVTDEHRARGTFGSSEKSGQRTGFPTIARSDPGVPDGVPVNYLYEDFFRVHRQPKSVRDRGDASRQYYVDPMADFLVVAIRPSGDKPGYGYFKGEPRVFPVRDASGRVMPVALNIRRDIREPRVRAPTQADFWDGRISTRSITGSSISEGQAGMLARVATLQLRAGESVDIDCWFVPLIEKLRGYFGWPEVLAVQAAYKVEKPAGQAAAYRKDIVDQLKTALGKASLDDSGFKKLLDRYSGQSAWVGMAGAVADPVAVAAAAEILNKHLLQRPLPEVAGLRTIAATHALARPQRKPKFPAKKNFAVLRTSSDDASRLKRLQDCQKNNWPDKLPSDSDRFGESGDDGVIFAGSILLDRDTCRQLEIRAFCTPPANAALDDTTLGRTELQRLLGEWPVRLVPDGSGKMIVPSQAARSLFGFHVDAEGKVYLPKRFTTLLLIDDLAERDKASDFAGLDPVDLVSLQLETMNRRTNAKADLAKGAVRAAPLDNYSDRLARRITVVVRATSRFDPYFVRLVATEESPLPERIFPSNPDQSRFITRQSFEKSLDPDLDPPWTPIPKKTRSEQAEVLEEELRHLWIPATIAPAKPLVHAILPAYDTDRPEPLGDLKPKSLDRDKRTKRHWTFIRRPRLRILLDRPWYSSGEGERLGLVLWPPRLRELGTNDPDALAMGKVPRMVLHGDGRIDVVPSGQEDVMELADFLDEDLGPGGKFTTRWGADPIRNSSGPTGPFLPREVLQDVKATSAEEPDDDTPGYVPSVQVPLKDLREKADEKASDGVYETLTAALATYVPRFDVETEKWFVDVALNPDVLVDPFVRFGLVRYQAQARTDLRVSAPVSVWTQIPPSRTVDVWASYDGKAQLVVEVQVSGRAAGRASSDDGKADRLAYPPVRISIIETKPTGAGLINERILEASGPKGIRLPAVAWAEWDAADKAGSAESARTKTKTFTLPQIVDDPAKYLKRQLSVLVEEVEDFLSTAGESASPPSVSTPKTTMGEQESDDSLVLDVVPVAGDEPAKGVSRSGPRFLSRIDITV